MGSQELEFIDAIRLIRQVDDVDTEELCYGLERLFDLFSQEELSDTYFIRHDLPYGKEVARNGQWIGHTDALPREFYNPQGFPLAMVVKGALEIFRPGSQYTKGRSTDAVLYAGHFVGIFEAFQHVFRRDRPVASFWNMSSGVTSAYVLDQFTQPHSKALNGKYNILVSKNDLESDARIVEQCRHYSDLSERLSGSWRTELVYFPSSFVEFVFDADLERFDDVKRYAILEVRRLIGEYALLAYTKSFGSSFPLAAYFEPEQVHFIQALISIKNSEKPIFAISKNFSNAMPSQLICDEFCQASGVTPFVIAPKRFEKLTVCGFIPISHLMGHDGFESKAKVERLLNGIRSRIRKIEETERHVAKAVSEVLSGIQIVVGKGAGASGYRLCGDDLSIENIDAYEFFRSIAEVHGWNRKDGTVIEKYHVPSSDFFSRCVMIPVNG